MGFIPGKGPIGLLGFAHDECTQLAGPIPFVQPSHYCMMFKGLDVCLWIIVLGHFQHLERNQIVAQPVLLSIHHLLLGIQDLCKSL